MADNNSSLPIRTETDGSVVSKICDATTPSQQLKVNPDGSLDVNASVSGSDLDIRDLSASQDNVAISDGTDTLAVNADGSLNSVVTATDLDIRDLNSATDSVTVVATNLDVRDLAFATDKVDVSGSSVTVSSTNLDIRDLAFATDKVDVSNSTGLEAIVTATDLDIRNLTFANDKVDVSGSTGLEATVSATDLDIRDLSASSDSVKIGDGSDFLAVNADGSLNVVVQDSAGAAVNNFNTGSAIAASGVSNHDYTVTSGKTLLLSQVEASASGKAKIEVKVETAASSGVFNTVFVQFNSSAEPNMTITLKEKISVAEGVKVRVSRTNRENQSQDLYSTICGNEV